MEIYGFTGTRNGLSNKQKESIIKLLSNKQNIEVHHGDCVGADKDFHDICTKLGFKIVIHPPLDSKLRAFCKSEYINKPKEYLDRNKDIVNSCNILIACPFSENEELRSGTWSTIRYCRKLKKDIIIYV
jgi:hypothetical protein